MLKTLLITMHLHVPAKLPVVILLIAGGAELLLLAFCFRQDQLLFFLLPLLIWPIFSLALIAFVRKKDPRPDLDLSELWLPASFDLFSFFSYH